MCCVCVCVCLCVSVLCGVCVVCVLCVCVVCVLCVCIDAYTFVFQEPNYGTLDEVLTRQNNFGLLPIE